MTNYEKYKNELIEIFAKNIGVDKFTGEPKACADMDCENRCNSDCTSEYTYNWLNAEYKPPRNTLEVSTLIAYLKQEPNQMKQVKTITIVDGMPVINGGE